MTGVKVVWGIPKEFKPIVNAPLGKQRLRFRNTSAGRLFVKTPRGIRHFVLVDDGPVWRVDYSLEQGRNLRRDPDAEVTLHDLPPQS